MVLSGFLFIIRINDRPGDLPGKSDCGLVDSVEFSSFDSDPIAEIVPFDYAVTHTITNPSLLMVWCTIRLRQAQ